MLQGHTRFLTSSKSNTGVIHVPADLVKDSLFPFKPNEQVSIRIDEERLVIERFIGKKQ